MPEDHQVGTGDRYYPLSRGLVFEIHRKYYDSISRGDHDDRITPVPPIAFCHPNVTFPSLSSVNPSQSSVPPSDSTRTFARHTTYHPTAMRGFLSQSHVPGEGGRGTQFSGFVGFFWVWVAASTTSQSISVPEGQYQFPRLGYPTTCWYVSGPIKVTYLQTTAHCADDCEAPRHSKTQAL
jgi:hypothetical protein